MEDMLQDAYSFLWCIEVTLYIFLEVYYSILGHMTTAT